MEFRTRELLAKAFTLHEIQLVRELHTATGVRTIPSESVRSELQFANCSMNSSVGIRVLQFRRDLKTALFQSLYSSP